MDCKFKAYGHPNITAKHKTTLEFTKDENLSLRGDCIVGVKADFSLSEIKKFIKTLKSKKIKIEIIIKKSINKKTIKNKINNKIIKEVIHAEVNPDFNSDREMVIRKSEFKDGRTFAVRSDKASTDFDRKFIETLGYPEKEIIIEIEQ